MIKFRHMAKEVLNHFEAIKAGFIPPEKLRFVNWYLQHGCDLDCSYCQVPKQKVPIMDRVKRLDALTRVRQLCINEPIISIIGGEPTLRPDFLVDAIRDASEAGFFVNLVTNGWGLTPELIKRLGEAGLQYLAISVDCDTDAEKSNLEKALSLHAITKEQGIIPVINTVITRQTDSKTFKHFAQNVISNGFFISPLVCSPSVPNGVFSSASVDSVPYKHQLREVVPWLARKKLITGRVTASFSYLWTMYNSGAAEDFEPELWHCSPTFRTQKGKRGRGSITLDSDGFIGPCQEFPRLVNIFNIPLEKLSLQLLDGEFNGTTQQCPGCLYNCYNMEEELGGAKVLAEIPTIIQIADVRVNRG